MIAYFLRSFKNKGSSMNKVRYSNKLVYIINQLSDKEMDILIESLSKES